MSPLADVVRRKTSLAPPVSPPFKILHAGGDCVEVSVAPNNRTGEVLVDEIKSKERELIYQKVILEGCQSELQALMKQLQDEIDPEERGELIFKAQKFALAVKGKKEQFRSSYKKWRESLASKGAVS